MTATILLTFTTLVSLLLLSLGVFVAAVPWGDLPGGIVVAVLGAIMTGATVALIIQEYGPRHRSQSLDALYVRRELPADVSAATIPPARRREVASPRDARPRPSRTGNRRVMRNETFQPA